ncbi:MAG: DUF418 domain-containing protein [Sphingomonadales bacterium]|nr:DUF418 domain-containing protein [Sphingomonadales bacterium]
MTVNIASFAAPGSATLSPDLPQPGSAADHWAYATTLVLFEGKMRALFSMLFGASMLLFIERQDAAGRDGIALQVRRLLWLALIGYAHFALLWNGDILFLYACVGLGAMFLRQGNPIALALSGLLLFAAWQGIGASAWLPSAAQEARIAAGTATPADQSAHANLVEQRRRDDQTDTAEALDSFTGAAKARLERDSGYPLRVVAYNWGETLTYILFGMALLRSGFFDGNWPRRMMIRLACVSLFAGLFPTLAFAAWAEMSAYPQAAMHLALSYGLGFPHLLMALGYAALLMLAAPRLLATAPGRWIEAAGRAAFSNYLGTTLLMTALFSGWGLALFGEYGAAARWYFVLLGWAAMLCWPTPWLRFYRCGPLEWLWRSLTEWRILPIRRSPVRT